MQVRYQAALRPDRALNYSSALEHLEDALELLAQRRGRDRLRNGHGLLAARVGGGARSRLLEAVARPVDGEAVLVEQLADAADEQHLVVLVIAAGGAAASRASAGGTPPPNSAR